MRVVHDFMDQLYRSSPHICSSVKSHLSGTITNSCCSFAIRTTAPILYGVTVKSGYPLAPRDLIIELCYPSHMSIFSIPQCKTPFPNQAFTTKLYAVLSPTRIGTVERLRSVVLQSTIRRDALSKFLSSSYLCLKYLRVLINPLKLGEM